MSLDTLAIVIGALIALAFILVEADSIIRALADYRLAGRRDLDGLVSTDVADEHIELAVYAAIRRADPELGPELVDRLAATVLEDLRDGVLGMSETSDPREGLS